MSPREESNDPYGMDSPRLLHRFCHCRAAAAEPGRGCYVTRFVKHRKRETGAADIAKAAGSIACGEQGLRVIQVPEMNGLLGVGATFEARPAADAIRAEIGDMAADGTLDRIASRWRFVSSQNLEVANELARVQTRERWLITGISGAVFLLLVTLWQAASIRMSPVVTLAHRINRRRSRTIFAEPSAFVGPNPDTTTQTTDCQSEHWIALDPVRRRLAP